MTVIPWISQADVAKKRAQKPTIVESDNDFSSYGNVVQVKEFDSSQFDEKGQTNASYDLCVGKEYRKFGEVGNKNLEPKSDCLIHLLPGTGAIIRVKEEVHFPKSRFGQIIPRASKLQEGLVNWPTKIDPGYNGPLFVTVYNCGSKPVKLRYGERFCALYILDVVEDGLRPYEKLSNYIISDSGRGFWKRQLDSLKASQPLVVIITDILFLISIIVTLFTFLYKPS
jgi:dCTP deaminase